MPSLTFFPFDNIQPSEILSQYSEWIYFTVTLVFFISVSGVTLRKHFDKPYVKPLIISVGLMLTFGAFRFKEQMNSIFDSWGILGSILLVVMVAIIHYGFCRGFGMSASKAFFLSFILVYIISLVKFPGFYSGLADQNLELVNLGLLILFFVSIFMMFKPWKFIPINSKDLIKDNPIANEIVREIGDENYNKGLITGQADKITKLEIRSVEDISAALDKIINIIQTHQNELPKKEREKIVRLLEQISKDEGIFKKNVQNLQRLFQRLGTVDAQHFRELKERLEKSSAKEKKLIMAEIEGEEEKLKIEQEVLEFERRLTQALNSFNQFLKSAIDHIRSSPYPYDAVHPLAEAKKVLTAILDMIKETGQLEEKLLSLAKTEKTFLKKERDVA